MHLKIVSAPEATQFHKFNSDPDHMKRSWPNSWAINLVHIVFGQMQISFGFVNFKCVWKLCRRQRRPSYSNFIPIPIAWHETNSVQDLCIWYIYQCPETDQFWIRLSWMHLKIVSASEPAQFRKFHSDSDHMKRSWPSVEVMHLA